MMPPKLRFMTVTMKNDNHAATWEKKRIIRLIPFLTRKARASQSVCAAAVIDTTSARGLAPLPQIASVGLLGGDSAPGQRE